MVKKVHASHILVETEREANEIFELIEEGADFGELAQERSSCPSAEQDGELGWFGKDEMALEFEAAAFSMDEGEISEPVQSEFGWHIIQVHQKK